MSLTPEWRKRIENFRREIKTCVNREIGTVDLEGFVTDEQLTPQQAAKREFRPMPEGTQWGAKWQYAWFRATVTVPKEADGKRVQLNIETGGETLIRIDGKAAGGSWHGGFANWGGRDCNRTSLTRKAKAGARHRLLMETYAGHGVWNCGNGPVAVHREAVPEPPKRQATMGRSTISIWNEEIYQLHMDVETLWHVREKLEQDSLRVSKIDDGLKSFTNIFDPELPWSEMIESAVRARRALAPLFKCVNGSSTPEFFAFGHAHIDVAWLWPLAHTERKAGITFSNQLALAAEYPEYKFLQSQPHLYMMLEKRYPEIYARVKKAVAKGAIVPDGGMWVEADTNITGGESLIRQFLHGKRYFKERFGAQSEMLWLPDVFGYSGALPQIMRGCGIRYFSTQKIYWTYNGGEPFPYVTFTWEGIDGSEVLAHFHNDYNSQTHPGATIQRWKERPQKDNIETRLFPFGWGDGGGGPVRDHLEYLRRQRDLEGAPKMRMASPSEFFKDLEKRGIPDARYAGELYFQAHRGTYTTQAKTKRGNRRAEFSLREAEGWAALAAAQGRAAYPGKKLAAAWQAVLLNQFHDIIPGSSIARVYEEAEKSYDEVISAAKEISAKALKSLSTGKAAITVFNSLNWERTALVALPKDMEGATDQEGRELPVQVSGKTAFAEVKAPSFGSTVLKPSGPGYVPSPVCRASKTLLENDLVRAVFNDLGEIVSFKDKKTGREIAAGPCNAMRMYKDVPASFDGWDLDSMYAEAPVNLPEKAQIRVLTQGPLFASIEVKRKLNNSMMRQEIVLRRSSRRIDFKTTVDWNEKHKLLKVNFPVGVYSDTAAHEIQFGHLKRPTHLSRQFDADRFEVSAHKWSALMEEDFGVAVLNDCKYGVNVLKNSINLTLLRASQAPDMRADLGKQEFTYALYAWNGPFAESAVVREGYELNAPVMAVEGDAGSRSYLSVDAANIVVETVKAAEDGSGDVILRLYDSKRVRTKGTLTVDFPVSKVWKCDMLENREKALPVRKGRIPLAMRPFEILTLRLAR